MTSLVPYQQRGRGSSIRMTGTRISPFRRIRVAFRRAKKFLNLPERVEAFDRKQSWKDALRSSDLQSKIRRFDMRADSRAASGNMRWDQAERAKVEVRRRILPAYNRRIGRINARIAKFTKAVGPRVRGVRFARELGLAVALPAAASVGGFLIRRRMKRLAASSGTAKKRGKKVRRFFTGR